MSGTTSSFELASRLFALRLAKQRHEAGDAFQIDESVPGLVLRINPHKVTPFPSSNPNAIEIIGDGSVLQPSVLLAAIERFKSVGISKFFFWLSPSSQSDSLERLLLNSGFQPFRGTNYLVLSKPVEAVEIPATEFSIRRLSKADAGLNCFSYDEAATAIFKSTLGVEGCSHFAAFDGDTPIATARLFVHDRLAYLCDAGTLEEYRGRGAQTALIAARLNHAADLGCDECAVETLGMLKTSLHNLLRAGFQHSFDKKVFEFSVSS